ncbi:vacuolar segregation subunit 7-domain-containing protein [Bisporella sp. PMI_857]|nr:vacuolar segregation subunit 7-domain-containing protein [Bisporella sp. PMI_857]
MDDKPFTSMSGAAQETAEPVETQSSVTPKLVRDSSTLSNVSNKSRQSSSSVPSKRIASATSSPAPSREASPVRPTLNKSTTRTSGPGRSRKNSTNDISPSRSTSTNSNPPSAAAQQRALSVASTPILKPAPSDSIIRAPVPQKLSVAAEIKETPRWPISPRLRSPPPVQKQPGLVARKSEQELPAISVYKVEDRPTPQASEQPGNETNESELDESLSVPGMRTPVRGTGASSSTLETVQEVSQPNTPGNGLDGVLEKSDYGFSQERMDEALKKASKSKHSGESGSESGGKSEVKMKSTNGPPPVVQRQPPTTKYSSNTSAGRGKPSGEGSTQNMTIETETVSSIPQVAMIGPLGGGNAGSVRAKPSSETIRPKKEKKKTARKTPSVASGTASSKADIFEAQVASAVDEANSSDSEETFVYESNPPDTQDRPRRFHSRTPSATSMVSQFDRNGLRSMADGGHSVAMKKSMKFAKSYNTNHSETPTGDDDGKGTARSNMSTGRGSSHYHVGRWNRNGGNGHPSLFDNESPFPNASKSKLAGNGQRQSSRPTSPRVSNIRLGGNGRKSPMLSYDIDNGADDERTPLMSSNHSVRSNRRRPGSSLRHMNYQSSRRNSSFLSRYAGCLVLTLVVIIVSAASIGFMFATTQPLDEVKVLALKNVLASEQDVIFDMKVEARNPNVISVSVDQTDLVIFAKSKYAGTDSQWWNKPSLGNALRWALRRRDDWWPPEDAPPEDDDPPTFPNLEIGHVYHMSSALSFDGSPFHHSRSTSTGQIRIINPGNHTTPAGSERWGRVLQHEFELIVRGTLKYSLPFSTKTRSISVEGRTTVKPNAADTDPDTIRIDKLVQGDTDTL